MASVVVVSVGMVGRQEKGEMSPPRAAVAAGGAAEAPKPKRSKEPPPLTSAARGLGQDAHPPDMPVIPSHPRPCDAHPHSLIPPLRTLRSRSTLSLRSRSTLSLFLWRLALLTLILLIFLWQTACRDCDANMWHLVLSALALMHLSLS